MTLTHDALVYDTDDGFVEVLAPFVAQGLAAGEAACVVTRPAHAHRLRDALGADADRVEFVDSADWYRKPARTIAGYHRTIRAARVAGAPGLRVVGEVEFGPSEQEHAAWARYESVLNAVFADDPVWIVCPYDRRRLPATVVDDAERTHSHRATGEGRRERCESFVDPHVFVSALPLALGGRPLVELPIDDDLRRVRETGAQVAHRAGLPAERAAELVLVLSELATNALVHGRPPALLRAFCDHERLVVEVGDRGGDPIDPLAGFRPPRSDRIGGAGLWIARQLADAVEVTSSPGGTTVRVRFDLAAHVPSAAPAPPAPQPAPTTG